MIDAHKALLERFARDRSLGADEQVDLLLQYLANQPGSLADLGAFLADLAPPPAAAGAPSWEQDAIQFPRLLSEIVEQDLLGEAGWDALLASMDLDSAELSELFDRAQREWDAIKARTAPPVPEERAPAPGPQKEN